MKHAGLDDVRCRLNLVQHEISNFRTQNPEKIQSSTGSRVHGLKIYLFKTSPMASIVRQSRKKRLTRLVQLKQGTLIIRFAADYLFS